MLLLCCHPSWLCQVIHLSYFCHFHSQRLELDSASQSRSLSLFLFSPFRWKGWKTFGSLDLIDLMITLSLRSQLYLFPALIELASKLTLHNFLRFAPQILTQPTNQRSRKNYALILLPSLAGCPLSLNHLFSTQLPTVCSSPFYEAYHQQLTNIKGLVIMDMIINLKALIDSLHCFITLKQICLPRLKNDKK